VIEDGGALFYRPETGGGTANKEKCFGQSGLAAPAVADEGDVTNFLR
jgi:hypothetical protein